MTTPIPPSLTDGLELVRGVWTSLKPKRVQPALDLAVQDFRPGEEPLFLGVAGALRGDVRSTHLVLTDQRLLLVDVNQRAVTLAEPYDRIEVGIQDATKFFLTPKDKACITLFVTKSGAAPVVNWIKLFVPTDSIVSDYWHDVASIRVGPGVSDPKASAAIDAIQSDCLVDGESLRYLHVVNRLRRPTAQLLAITDRRLLAVDTMAHAGTRVTWFGWPGDFNVDDSAASITIIDDDDAMKFPCSPGDGRELSRVVRDIPTSDDAYIARAEEQSANREAPASPKEALGAWIATLPIFGATPNAASSRIVRDHSQGEDPWLVIGSGIAGVLAAFSDRLMIVKAGAMTGIMAGTLGGHRSTTFHFTDITGIEFNAGVRMGVLEILTPSYQGTANKDYWQGTRSGRNSNSNDPWTLSNTLPLSKSEYQSLMPQLEELRKRISDSKRPQIVVQSPSPVGDLSKQLAQIAELHSQGALSDDEFSAAKARLLNPD